MSTGRYSMSDQSFKNQWFWLCGSSSGIGFAVAEEMAKNGANLILMALSEEKLQKAKLKLMKYSGEVTTVVMDIADPWSERRISELLGGNKLHGVLLNGGGPHGANALQVKAEDLHKAHNLLLAGPVMLLHSLLPHLEDKSSIVAITSTTVKEPNPDLVLSAVYRTGLTVYLKHLSDDLGKRGIRINQVAPGFTGTERLEELAQHVAKNRFGENTPDNRTRIQQAWKEVATLKRIAAPEEIAHVCRFLLSDESSFITGQTIVADGGQVRGYF